MAHPGAAASVLGVLDVIAGRLDLQSERFGRRHLVILYEYLRWSGVCVMFPPNTARVHSIVISRHG